MAGLPATLDGGYRLVDYAQQSAIGGDDLVALWTGEGVLREEAARARVAEALLIATHERDGLVGVSTAVLRHSDQLGLDAWYYRTFVASAHRQSALAITLLARSTEVLAERRRTGEETSACGVLVDLQNQRIQRAQNKAVWPRTGFVYIGENGRGDPLRLFPFPGATAPAPRVTA